MVADSFDEDDTDKWINRLRPTLAAATTLGGLVHPLIGLVGPFLAEYVTSTIPNQRLDRVISYLRFIREQVPDEVLQKLAELPDRMALLEEGVLATASTPYKYRIKIIASAVADGISKEDFDIDHEGNVINIIKNLSRVDGIVLKYYSLDFIYKRDYQNKHKDILTFPYGDMKALELKKSKLRSYTEKLHSYGLLEQGDVNLRNPMRSLGGGSQSDYQITMRIKEAIEHMLNRPYTLSALGKSVLGLIEQAPDDSDLTKSDIADK